jgi:hypothetical protein
VTKEEFCGLPLSVALGIMYDVAPDRFAKVPKPDVARPPKFDGRVSRKGGMFTWASEMLLADLEFWQKRNAAGASDGSQYAEKNAKNAKMLSYWVAYRQAFPAEQWSGERNRTRVTANAPSRDPEQHAWESRGDAPPASNTPSGGGFSDADYGTAAPPDDDLGF